MQLLASERSGHFALYTAIAALLFACAAGASRFGFLVIPCSNDLSASLSGVQTDVVGCSPDPPLLVALNNVIAGCGSC